MKKIFLLSFLSIFIFSQNITATPVDIIKPKTPTEESVQVKKKKKKKRFFARMTERIMKKRVGRMIKKLGLDPKNCDRIIKTDGEELDVIIVNVGPERIRYKKCDFQNGPTRSIQREDIFMIKYANGKKKVLTDIEKLKDGISKSLKTSNQKNQDTSTRQDWNLGFLIGILLGLIGLLVIALAMTGDKRKRALRGALAGMFTIILISIAFALLLLSAV